MNEQPKRKLQIVDYDVINKKCEKPGVVLMGSATVAMPGLIIRKILHFDKNGQRWLTMPSEVFTGKNGKKVYTPLVDFPSKEIAERFRVSFFEALDEWLKLHPEQAKPTNNGPEIADGDIPW